MAHQADATWYNAERLYSVLYPAPRAKSAPPRRPAPLPGPTMIADAVVEADPRWTNEKWLRERFRAMDLTAGNGAPPPPPQDDDDDPGVPPKMIITEEVGASPPTKPPLKEDEEDPRALRQRARMTRLASPKYGRRERKKAAAALLHRGKLVEMPAMRSAMQRLGSVAATMDPLAHQEQRDLFLGGWEFMTPTMLSKFLTTKFRLTLTPAELGCLVRWLDANGDGRVDAGEFLREFWKFGAVERKRRHHDAVRRKRRFDFAESRRQQRWIQRYGGSESVDVRGKLYTKDHFDSAMRALKNAAYDFDVHSAYGAMVRDTVFHAGPLSPGGLAAVILRLFNVAIDPLHLVALVGAHDPKGTGLCDGKAFYRTFTQLGLDEHKRREHKRLAANKLRHTDAIQFQHNAALRFGGHDIHKKVKIIWPDLKQSQSSPLTTASSPPPLLRSTSAPGLRR